MYLGRGESLLSIIDSTRATRVDVASKIVSWREDNLDFPWHKFVEWFMQKHGSGIRTPDPQPELFYKSVDAFLSDVALFEKELYGTVVSDVGETIVEEEEEYPDYGYPIEEPPSLPPDYYMPPAQEAASEGDIWIPAAIGAGALVVILLAMKKKR